MFQSTEAPAKDGNQKEDGMKARTQGNEFKKENLIKTGTILAVVMSLFFVVFYFAIRTFVIDHAETDIRNLLMDQKGIHQYVQEVMHPALYTYQAEGEIPKAFYAPELFSSSFIVRNQHVFYNQERERQGLPPLYYKLAAVNPRNPLNLADARESQLIAMFNADRTKTDYREIIERNGDKYLYVALPFLANTHACIKCHGKREDAPVQLQARYSGEGGFNEQAGDIRAIISIQAPLAKEYTTIFISMASLLAGLLAVTGLFLFNSRLRHLVSIRTHSLEKEIDERKWAQKETALSFERFKSVLDAMDALVYVADIKSYEILFVNKIVRDNWGEITGSICWQTLQQNQQGPCPFCTNSQLLNEKGEPAGIVIWEFQNTIDHEWYECRDQAIQWTDGRFVRMEIATNITQRKHMHQALAEEKELLAVTLRSIGDGVITTDTHGRVVLINKVALALTGWDAAEAGGQVLTDVFRIIDGSTGLAWKSPVEKILASGKTVEQSNNVILISRNGSERNIAFSGSPIQDDGSRIIGMVLVFRDITVLLRTEQELIKVKKLESVGVLAGGIAHDFNNILTIILGNIELARLDNNLSAESLEVLQEAEMASLRAQGLTKQLLTFAKGGAPVKETASLPDIIMESANFILHGNSVACRSTFPDDLWQVDIDKGQISQVVQNIILNASQAMPNGGFIEVICENVDTAESGELDTPGGGRYVKMSIKDRGIGIPANILERIFDPYFSTKQRGSGLGLAITHSIIAKHGGFISVESTPGSGSKFVVYLPASEDDLVAAKKPVESEVTPGKKTRIMVMDDEEQIRNMTQRMLTRIGHEVTLAANGEEAVQQYREAYSHGTPIDLVILDLTIPGGMGGKDAVREILAIDAQAKVVVASGYSTDPVMASFTDFGFCDAIVKPFQQDELKMMLKRVLTEAGPTDA
jgi:PAS domain S-box-containing protein